MRCCGGNKRIAALEAWQSVVLRTDWTIYDRRKSSSMYDCQQRQQDQPSCRSGA
jgi:hypothetical protein